MMELSIVSISVSGIVALIQVINFFETRHAKGEAARAVYAKANDVKVVFDDLKRDIADSIGRLKDKTEQHTQAIHNQEIDVSVLKTQVSGLDKSLDHIIDTLDTIMTRISEDR